jgi:23S rRNA (adenine2503-C2)-methyltransferase
MTGEGTSKFLFQTQDGIALKASLFPNGRQGDCLRFYPTRLSCPLPFCASGKTDFLRNLTAAEIIEQVAWIARKSGRKITNVVFMGMGEPLENFEEVMKALDILTASWGFELGGRKITVSTSGVPEKILEFVKRTDGRIRLSFRCIRRTTPREASLSLITANTAQRTP